MSEKLRRVVAMLISTMAIIMIASMIDLPVEEPVEVEEGAPINVSLTLIEAKWHPKCHANSMYVILRDNKGIRYETCVKAGCVTATLSSGRCRHLGFTKLKKN